MLSIKSLVADSTDDRDDSANSVNDGVNRDGNTANVDRGEDATATAPATQLPIPSTTPYISRHGLRTTQSESPRRYTPPTLPRHNRVASAGLRITIPDDNDYYAYALCHQSPQLGCIYSVFVPRGPKFPVFIPGHMIPCPVPQYPVPHAGVMPGSIPPAGSIHPVTAPTDSMPPLSLPGPMLPHSVPHAGPVLPASTMTFAGFMPPTMNNTSIIIPASTFPQGMMQGSTFWMAISNFPQNPILPTRTLPLSHYTRSHLAQDPLPFRQLLPNGHSTLSQTRASEPQLVAPKRKFNFVEPILPPDFVANPNNHGRWQVDRFGRWHSLNVSKI